MPLVFVGHGFSDLLHYSPQEVAKKDILFYAVPPEVSMQKVHGSSALLGLQQGATSKMKMQEEDSQSAGESAANVGESKLVKDMIMKAIYNNHDVTVEFTGYRKDSAAINLLLYGVPIRTSNNKEQGFFMGVLADITAGGRNFYMHHASMQHN